MTPHFEACLSGGGRIGQVGIGRNNLLKPVRRASCKRILCNYPGVWRARNCDGKYGRRPFKKRTADIAAAFEKLGKHAAGTRKETDPKHCYHACAHALRGTSAPASSISSFFNVD